MRKRESQKNVWGVDILDSKNSNDPKSVLYRKSLEGNVLYEDDENSNMNPRLLYQGTYEGQGTISGEVVKNKDGKWIITDKKYRWIWVDNDWKKQNIVVTYNQLKDIFSKGLDSHLKNIETEINLNYTKYKLTNFNIIAHFLGQIAHETGGLRNNTTEESGYYKNLERIGVAFNVGSKVYNKVKSNPDFYLKNSEHFLNMAYANKGGNGDESSGDGYKYRGRGYIQLTLKDNYSAFNTFYKNNYDESIDFIKTPELIGTDNYFALISSLHYFMTHTIQKINKSTTQGDKISYSEFEAITLTINSNMVAIQERLEYYKKAYHELTKPI